jgi:hypothetical protein
MQADSLREGGTEPAQGADGHSTPNAPNQIIERSMVWQGWILGRLG